MRDRRDGHDRRMSGRLRARSGSARRGPSSREAERFNHRRRVGPGVRCPRGRHRLHRRLGLDGTGAGEGGTRKTVSLVSGEREAPRPREVGRHGHALPDRASGPRNHGRSHRRSAIDRLRPGGKPTPCAEGDSRPIPRGSLRASREPVNRVRPLRTIVRGLRRWLRLVAVVLILAGIVAAVAFPEAAWNAIQLPLFAFFSTMRMVVAYLFALVFAIAYGHTAATNKRASAALLPLLDVLQSIPILGFFPAALIFFVATFRGHPIGIEFAVVFLIFTSMAWNMAFGVYESLTTIPADLEAAAASFGLRGWLRFRYLPFPAAIPKLVYNSILSWTNGWFFLVASEIFSAGGTEFQRPGLGAFIAVAGRNGDVPSIAIGIGVLEDVMLTISILGWRLLGAWSCRGRMETAPGREIPRVPSPYERFRWLPRLPKVRKRIIASVQPAVERYHRLSLRFERAYTQHPKAVREIRRVDLAPSVGAAAQLAAILIALFSMQWYLLFNLIAGVRSIPDDLKEAARSFGLRGRAYWKRLLLPAIAPSLLTGSITAWGAGWNALIVSEYIQYAHQFYEVPGLGSLLNHAVYPTPDNEMLLLTILTMIVVVLAMNKLLWRPLFRRASSRFRLEV